MAALTFANLTFTITNNLPAGGSSGKPEVIREMSTRNRKYVEATIAFGDGVLTYPTGGIPLFGATLSLGMGGGTEPTQACVSLGCPHVLESLNILGDPSTGANSGFIPLWDKPNNKLMLFVGGAAASLPLAQAGAATTPQVVALRVNAFGW